MSAHETKRLALRATIARAVAEHDETVSGPERLDDPDGHGYSLHTVEVRLERAIGVIAGAHHDDVGFDEDEVRKALVLLSHTRREVQCIRRALESAGVLRSWTLREHHEHLAPRSEEDDDGDHDEAH